MEQMVEQKKMEKHFNQLVEARKRFNELDITETKGLLKLFGVKRAELNERKKQLNENESDSNDNNDGES